MASAYSATRWILFSSFGFRILSLGGQMFILRHLDKDGFGAYRSIILIHMMMLAIMPLGLDSLVVRERKHRLRYTLATSQALAITGGLLAILAIGAVLLPFPGARSFGATQLGLGSDYPVMYFMAPIFLIQAAKLAMRSLLSARLDFRTISIGEFGNGMITWMGGAIAVMLIPRAWALMALYAFGELFECCWLYRHRVFRPISANRPERFGVLRRLFRRNRRYLLFNTADLTLNNVASLLPGVLFTALISTKSNADYSVALQLLVLPTMLLAGALWRVAFPSMSGISENELRRRCLAIISGAAAFVAPSVIWFAFFAPSTVLVLGGHKYVGTATPIVRWMSIYMIFTAIYSPVSSLDMIRNKPHVGLIWNMFYLSGRIAVIYNFAQDGLLATVAAQSIFSLSMWVIWAWVTGRLLAAPWRDFLKASLKYAPLWGSLAICLYLCMIVTGDNLLWAPVLSAIPCLAYMAAVWMWFPGEAAMLRKLAFRRERAA